MTYNDAHTDLFDRYLRGELPAAENASFEKMIADDQDVAEAFHFHKILVSGIQDHGRLELKNYLQEHAVVQSGGISLWKGKMLYAAAAVLVILTGTYVVFNFYGSKNELKEIAVIEHKQEERISSDSPAMAHHETAPDPVMPTQPPPVAFSDRSLEQPTPPALESLMEPQMMDKAHDEDLSPPLQNGREDIRILAEKKLQDSLFTIPVLYASLEKEEETANTKYKDDVEVKKSAKAKARIPSNNNYAGNAANDYKKETTDTTVAPVYSTDTRTDKLKSNKPFTRTLKVEFWQSPVNFKGYRYSENLVQLYGLSSGNVRLYILNNVVYVKAGTTIYKLLTCMDACPYHMESDPEIIKYINQQN